MVVVVHRGRQRHAEFVDTPLEAVDAVMSALELLGAGWDPSAGGPPGYSLLTYGSTAWRSRT